MTFADINFRPGKKVLRQFAGALLTVALAFGAYHYLGRGHHALGIALASAGLVLGGLGLLVPQAVRWLFVASMLLVLPIGWLVSQLILLTIFILFITPLAVLFRLCGRDALLRRWPRKDESLWQTKQTPETMSRYFRQY